MKKLLLTLGSAAAVVAPLATVVACGDEGFTLASYVPQEDGIFLMGEYYGGTLYDEDGEEFKGDILPIADAGWTPGTDPVIQFGKGDSFVVVYDSDDEDGFTIDNFEDTFGFADSSTAYTSTLANYNVSAYDNVLASNDWGDSTAVYTTFENGFSNRHVGSTFGFGDTGATLLASKDALGTNDYNALLDAYKYEELTEGVLTDAAGFDDSENGPDEYLRGGAVVAPQTGRSMFEYEKLGDNAIKVTYLFDNDSFDLNGGSFGFITETDTTGEYTIDNKGTFSFGENSWAGYNANDAHIYQGKKA